MKTSELFGFVVVDLKPIQPGRLDVPYLSRYTRIKTNLSRCDYGTYDVVGEMPMSTYGMFPNRYVGFFSDKIEL